MYGLFRKYFINFLKLKNSKVHEVVAKLIKVEKGWGGTINMSSLNHKILGLVFVKPNIPPLKYGKDMEIEAHTFNEIIKGKHDAQR